MVLNTKVDFDCKQTITGHLKNDKTMLKPGFYWDILTPYLWAVKGGALLWVLEGWESIFLTTVFVHIINFKYGLLLLI